MLQDYAPAYAAPRRRSKPDVQAIAAERLRSRRGRVRRIRKRVIATALVTFTLLWAVIFVQLVSGNDPALSKKTTVAASSTSTGTSSGSGTTSSSSGSGSGTTSSGSGSGASSTSGSGTTSPITTSQS
jgi:cytoskeletal protein RodZ